jgi:hypothetical protein
MGKALNMAEEWYVETRSPGVLEARDPRTFPEFDGLLDYVEKFKESASKDDFLRIIASTNATNEQYRELQDNGATVVR